jgi:stage II sporulation protein AA (anti-sigma F factor antagonist)
MEHFKELEVPGFSFTVEIEDDNKLVVRPRGSLDFHTVGILKEAIYPLCSREEITNVVFDYADVEYSDSSSFGLLLKINRTLGGNVRVMNVRPSIKRIFELAGFDNIFLKS